MVKQVSTPLFVLKIQVNKLISSKPVPIMLDIQEKRDPRGNLKTVHLSQLKGSVSLHSIFYFACAWTLLLHEVFETNSVAGLEN